MAHAHGNKRYYQILIDPNRAALLQRYAEDLGIRQTELMRKWIYACLEQAVPSKYEQAKELDLRLWEQSVKNRVKGRQRRAQAA